MTNRREEIRKIAIELSKRLSDEGKLIEAGWVGFRMMVIPNDAPPSQRREMKLAFFAGANHLFQSMMAILDPDAEPTDADMARMSLIHDELEQFTKQFAADHIATKGNA